MMSPAFSLIRASIEFTQATFDNPSDLNALEKPMQKLERTFERLRNTLYFSDFKF